jgi:hypothetical protein
LGRSGRDYDERGFASMHIYHVTSGTPVVAILRPARTPKGTEVRTVIKHMTKRLRTHWPNTRILDAAVVLADRLDLFDLAGRHCFEIAFDIGMECRLVVLHG